MTKHMAALEIERNVASEEALPWFETALRGQARGSLVDPLAVPASLRAAPAAEVKAEAAAGSAAQGEPPAKKRGSLSRLLLAGAGLAGLAGLVYFGWNYWTVGRFQITTDDAYVQADSTIIAPKVSGYIAQVLVRDNQKVKAGQILARIDDRDYKTALEQAMADVAAARASVLNKEAALDQQQSVIATARGTVDVDKAQLTFAEQEDRRYSRLAATGFGSVQNAQRASSSTDAARAAVARDEAALATAIKQLAFLKAAVAEAKASVAHDEAVAEQGRLNLSYTAITAPIDGIIGNRTLRIGQYVQAGTRLMAVVPLSAAYVVANYKETQLTDVRPGQKVEIAVDMFPGVTVHGHVDSIAPASGQEFALLPPDNATGNFTKIVQRIPVKIVLDPHDPLAGRLRPGMSVSPTIETKDEAQHLVTAQAHAG